MGMLQKKALRDAALWSLVLLAPSCAPKFDVPANANLSCSSEADCPADFVCRIPAGKSIGFCLEKSQAGAAAPSFLGPVTVTPARVGPTPGYDRASIAFTVDTDVGLAPPGLEVTVGRQPVTCKRSEAANGFGYSCDFVLGADTAEGEAAVEVWARGVGRTETSAHARLVVDRTPPAVAGAVVSYGPPPSSPISQVSRATVGSTITITLVADEPLNASPPPSLVLATGAAALSFERGPVDGGQVTFTRVLGTDTTASGLFVPAVTWTDQVGNQASALAVPTAQVGITLTSPALTVAQDKVCLLRSPWGATEPSGTAFPIAAGPYFGLAPFDTLSDDASLPKELFLLDGGIPPKMVRVWADGGREVLLAAVRPAGDGSWPRARLPVDVAAVWVSGVDDAGNESEGVRLGCAELVATPNANEAPTPHRLREVAQAGATREPEATAAVDRGVSVASPRLSALSTPAWRGQDYSLPTLTPRFLPAVAYDRARGQVVLYGGLSPTYDVLGDTWEYDGLTWRKLTPRANPKITMPFMGYDPIRDRTLLLGHKNVDDPFDELWEWDGDNWSLVNVDGLRPPARNAGRLEWDSSRGRLLLFGGVKDAPAGSSHFQPLSDLWAWDGTSWEMLSDSGAAGGPAPRAYNATAYDPLRGRLVVVGGCTAYDFSSPTSTPCIAVSDEVWEWDGAAWSKITPSTSDSPEPLFRLGCTFDAVRGEVVCFGGENPTGTLNGLWSWNGSRWLELTGVAGTPPAALSRFGMVAKPDGTAFLVAGTTNGVANATSVVGTTWSLAGSGWRDRTLSGSLPPPRQVFYHAYDSARDRLLVFGGLGVLGVLESDLWEWNGFAWDQRCDGVPSTDVCSQKPTGERWGGSAVYDVARQRTVFFAGCTDQRCDFTTNELWEWDGKDWQLMCDDAGRLCPDGPLPLYQSAHLAYDAKNGVVAYLANPNTGIAETWSWDGTQWTVLCPGADCTTQPDGRLDAVLATDPTGGVLLHSGLLAASSSVDDSTWRWNGTTWAEVATTGQRPPAGFGKLGAFVPDTSVFVTMAGLDAKGVYLPSDVWDLVGESWTRRVPLVNPIGNRSFGGLFRVPGEPGLATAFATNTVDANVWRLDMPADRRSALEFGASAAQRGFAWSQLQRVRARARCIGTSAGGPGAALEVWRAGGWVQVAENTAGVTADLASSELVWASASAAEAQQVVTARDLRSAMRCVPRGTAGAAGTQVDGASFEIRLRYQTGP